MEEIADRADTVIYGAGAVTAAPSPARLRARQGSERRARRVQVGVRLTAAEKATVDARAAAAGLTAPDFLRRASLGGRARMRTPAETGDRAVQAALRAVAAEIGKVGNNLNQVAHGVNVALLAGRAPSPDVAALDGIGSALEGLRREIRQAMSAGWAGPP